MNKGDKMPKKSLKEIFDDDKIEKLYSNENKEEVIDKKNKANYKSN